MTPISLQSLAAHAPTQDTVVLEVGRLTLTLRWAEDGWTLDAAASEPPHPVDPALFLRFSNERIGTVIPHQTFGRLAIKATAMKYGIDVTGLLRDEAA